MKVNVIGAGLAGCEAAWQLAQRNIDVVLYEMKPVKRSPAHSADGFAELVCSNSLRADRIENAVGLLKEEMRRMDSLIIACADATRVPAGGALAVDRQGFSALVTERIKTHPRIEVICEEVTGIEGDIPTIIATGPLTSEGLSEEIGALLGEEYLYFFDAAAPIVTKESIDMSKAFYASRYNKGGADYINCAMNRAEYESFYQALISAETVQLKDFENNVFEGCMPVEVMAARGVDTLRYGPLKPVGIHNPHCEERPYAVVQLRQDDSAASLFNIVGFQTHLTFPEQRRVFSLIPGLEHAEFVRYGVMHRNTFMNSPKLLDNHYVLKQQRNIAFAGQMTGVEGYVESAASGLWAGLTMACRLQGKEVPPIDNNVALFALANYVSSPNASFQPMNINFGIMNPLNERIRNKRDRALAVAERSLARLEEWLRQLSES